MARARALALLLALPLALGACGGGQVVQPRPETVKGQLTQPTLAQGNPQAGKAVFEDQGCGGCHTLKEAGTNGTTGPNLDEVLKGKEREFIRESIVNPNAEIAQGYQPNIMPSNYGQQLSQTQLADLVAYLAKSTS